MSAPNKSYDPVEVAALTPENVEAAVAAALEAFAAAADLDALKAARLAHAGDKSPLVPGQPRDRRPAARGQGRRRQARRPGAGPGLGRPWPRASSSSRPSATSRCWPPSGSTSPCRRSASPPGARHPLQTLQEQIADMFVGMGWEVAEGPEVEAEWFNFDALNFDQDHPARQMQDTFFVDPPESGLVLRTHTSPVQVRTLLERGAPTYVICPGKVFRTDELDATHTPVFHQIEGLAVDKGLTMAHLKGTLEHWAHLMFGPDITLRLRPSYFPFTEPSAEPDLLCFVCKGADPGCRTCGGSGWIEWGGCGMVHPNVLRACGVDPDVYSGFAFGMGVERTLMFRNGVADMRDMIEGDVRFSRRLGAGV